MANTALHIKRIQQEIKDFQTNPSDSFHAAPLKDELHIWHFTIKGPTETEFEGGIYHGKIELPFDYPFKPPALYFLTVNYKIFFPKTFSQVEDMRLTQRFVLQSLIIIPSIGILVGQVI